MSAGPGQAWTREQTLAALSLYCQIPFGKMHHRNASVIALASRLGRTPSSVAFRLVNLASLDPEHHERGVRGMSNASAMDRQVWSDYYGRWDELAEAANTTGDELTESECFNVVTEAESTVKSRRGQAFFRRAVLSAYEGACCVTGIHAGELLRASHIVPWSQNHEHRLDPRNGIALNALHDACFDRGLLTFDQKLRLVVGRGLKDYVPNGVYDSFFGRFQGEMMRLPLRFRPHDEFLDYHRTRIFEE
ncbi:MAG: HNH endonuclease [Phycisphaeraceae bacterium]